MYQTLSTKDVDVSERRKMFDQENKAENRQPNSRGNSAKKNRLLDQLRDATKERDRLLSEYAELTESKIMPLIMALEMQIQKNVEENRKFESDIAEIKSRETKTITHVLSLTLFFLSKRVNPTQPSKLNEERRQPIMDQHPLGTTNNANEKNQGTSDNYDSLMSMIQHQENKDAMGKTFYKKHLHEDISLWDVKEETEKTDVLSTEDKEEKMDKKKREKQIDKSKIIEQEEPCISNEDELRAKIDIPADMKHGDRNEQFSQDKYQPDTLQKILKSEQNATVLEQEKETRTRRQRDFTKSRYDTLESLIYKPENQAAIIEEQHTVSVTPIDLLKRLESEITMLMKKDSIEQKENDNWTKSIELLRQLESEINNLTEREVKQKTNFEFELKQRQDKYTDLEKKHHKKKDELKHAKTELQELKHQNQVLLSKLQNS
ncbi:hypothetical protein KUTeg_019437 [Tegillarca granosa]|uniref:Viral A-type inclusion protein n=1 Tax=Tegillarca granosa TaxID=220873 RepID=A0ABQ9EGR2_TEGGR|nr:hypothetical protein KUTeg_019437 [Tegillarca granosa]